MVALLFLQIASFGNNIFFFIAELTLHQSNLALLGWHRDEQARQFTEAGKRKGGGNTKVASNTQR